ncbi:MAG: signal peptidase II [Endomicrobiaceae bacterium]|jgi:signal peptidase II|nr:signal peptidase II [Endomicrobiaceae bacterium]MDD3729612.1 signal peptidase II [Endomicrobiaceae bacterium]MDD4165412.1 signal peptidase II [Endomicrobiaceae bacterium]
MIYLILTFIYVFADQITKFLIVTNIPLGSGVRTFDYLNIIHITNTGVAFSMFQGANFVFTVITASVVAGVLLFISKYKNELTKLQIHAMVLIISGGIGNLIDRIFRGAVVDFIDVGYKTVYRWPAFNVADSCVFIGVFLFLFSMLFQKNNKS